MSWLLFAAIAGGITALVRLIIWAGDVHDRRRCSVPGCIVCRVTGKGGGR
jgi:hypothetical protein